LSGTSSTNQKYEEVMRIALEEASSILPQRYIVMLLQDSGIMAPRVSLKRKFIQLWRRELVRRDNMIEIDGA